jgi:hypothetical protein
LIFQRGNHARVPFSPRQTVAVEFQAGLPFRVRFISYHSCHSVCALWPGSAAHFPPNRGQVRDAMASCAFRIANPREGQAQHSITNDKPGQCPVSPIEPCALRWSTVAESGRGLLECYYDRIIMIESVPPVPGWVMIEGAGPIGYRRQ